MRNLIQPQISLNGTDRQSLLDQQRRVLEALDDLVTAMSHAIPHGRDYQYRPAEYPLARDAWIERMSAIVDLKDEITAHAIKMQD